MSGRSHSRGEGDWTCTEPGCGNTNFARRDRCNRCGKDKRRGNAGSSGQVKVGGFELGKHMAEKSKGLFSADDWQCKTCGNVNWARRSSCNVCNTPKVGQVEVRSGFGGGFMERDENPDKIQRNSDDEEYDEFGRKKKKFRGSVPGRQPTPPPSKEKVDDGEEDEEEDSDDEDLSKYAFDSDDADEVKKETPKKKGESSSGSSYSSYEKGDANSRSPSRARSETSSASSRSRYSRSRSRSPL